MTDQQMREHLESIGYDLTDSQGDFSELVMVEIATNIEKYKWHEKSETWSA